MTEQTYGLFPAKKKHNSIDELKEKGARVVLFPEFDVETVAPDAALIKKLMNYDWLVFTDIFAADIFMNFLTENDFDLFELDILRILAAGEAVADRLRFEQIHSDVIPLRLTDREIFESLESYQTDLENAKCLVINALGRDIGFVSQLENAGAKVDQIGVYRINFRDETDLPKLKAFMKGGTIDEIVFDSPGEITVFQKLFEMEDLPAILEDVRISGTDDVTRKSIWENGLGI